MNEFSNLDTMVDTICFFGPDPDKILDLQINLDNFDEKKNKMKEIRP